MEKLVPPPATWVTPDPLMIGTLLTTNTLSHPLPIFNARSVPVDPVMLVILTPYKDPAPTPAAFTYIPDAVPPVVILDGVSM